MNETNATTSSRPRIALLGAGTMGAGIAERLLDQGFTVDVWNRTPGPAAHLAERGATAYTKAARAVADADVVLTMLPTAEAVTDVMVGQGTLHELRSGAVWAQMGTIGLEATERLTSQVARERPDVAFVDAPVSGSRGPARNGGLLILASGPEHAEPILAPVFAALGKRTLWLGAAGAGTRMKLILNTWLAFEVEATAETSALATHLGIATAVLSDAIAGSPLVSPFAAAKLAKMQAANDQPDFSLERALKDLELARTAAGPAQIPIAGAVVERWQTLVNSGLGLLDVSAARLGLEDNIEMVAAKVGRS
jgi:3-hydroxyisobutyrate dehydrogenase